MSYNERNFQGLSVDSVHPNSVPTIKIMSAPPTPTTVRSTRSRREDRDTGFPEPLNGGEYMIFRSDIASVLTTLQRETQHFPTQTQTYRQMPSSPATTYLSSVPCVIAASPSFASTAARPATRATAAALLRTLKSPPSRACYPSWWTLPAATARPLVPPSQSILRQAQQEAVSRGAHGRT